MLLFDLLLQEWNQHFFMLTNTGLYFTDQTDMKEDDDDDDNLSVSSLDINGPEVNCLSRCFQMWLALHNDGFTTQVTLLHFLFDERRCIQPLLNVHEALWTLYHVSCFKQWYMYMLQLTIHRTTVCLVYTVLCTAAVWGVFCLLHTFSRATCQWNSGI